MDNKMTPFLYKDVAVRVVEDDHGNPWWVAKDVCQVLELENASRALESLDDDEKGVTKCNTLGGNQEMLTVSESGLYHLIFKSRKEEAKKFRKWITSEVVPALRKTGSYSLKRDAEIEELKKKILELEDTIHMQKYMKPLPVQQSLPPKKSKYVPKGFLNVTHIGFLLDLSGHRVNDLLIELGYQKLGTFPNKYEPTEEGSRFAEECISRNKPYKISGEWITPMYLKWHPDIVQKLKEGIKAQ